MANSESFVGEQLALGVQLRDDATLDNFLPAPGLEPLLPLLQRQLEPEGEALIYLHGAEDTGKSHLLQAACHARGAGSAYLPLAELASFPPGDVLAGLASSELVCLDDLQAVAGQADWERELFLLFNTAREKGCRLLLSADCPPRRLALQLADLRSRFAWGVVFALPVLDDERRAAILGFRAGRRGLSLSPEVCSYILNRAPRGMGPLLALLETLDRESLSQQRALSIPFVRSALGW